MPENTEFPDASVMAQRLVENIRRHGSVAVAFSGGVDSAVVAYAAYAALSEKAVAVTAVSPSLAQSELTTARATAEQIGIRHVELPTHEFERPEYRSNASNRCFYCKDTLYTLTTAKLKELGVACVVNGTNTDDLGDHRPGLQAASHHGIVSPLVEIDADKKQVRRIARYWNLHVSEKPASPCLSSRIAYGVEVTEDRVRRVELAEEFLRQEAGLSEFRIRLEAGELARIEVPLDVINGITRGDLPKRIAEKFRALGFQHVTLDLEGFRSGSLNDQLPLVSLSTESL